MHDAILDTGPPLHLREIGRLHALKIFEGLAAPGGVQQELSRFEVWHDLEQMDGIEVDICEVPAKQRDIELQRRPQLQSADGEVMALARSDSFQRPVLTDDLALREAVLEDGGRAVGAFGVLLRGHATGQMTADETRAAVDDLMTSSSLHLGRMFRRYMKERLDQILRG